MLYGHGYGEPELLIDFAYFRIVWTLEVSCTYQLIRQTALFRPLKQFENPAFVGAGRHDRAQLQIEANAHHLFEVVGVERIQEST
jgi:hypothetical protein